MIKIRRALVIFIGLMVVGCTSHKSEYDTRLINTEPGSWASIKYNVKTGEAWKVVDGSLVKIIDTDNPPQSKYEIAMVSLENGRWGAIRLDVRSGRIWRIMNTNWVELKEKK